MSDASQVGVRQILCRDEGERDWFLDMHRRLEPYMVRTMVLVLAIMLPCAPWLEPLAFLPMALAIGVFGFGHHFIGARRQLEPMVIAWPIGTALMALSAGVNAAAQDAPGLAYVLGLSLIIWPLLAVCGGLPARLVAAATVWCALLVIVPIAVVWPSTIAEHPPLVATPILMFGITSIMTSAVRRASIEHRTAAVVDQLTGMLNRTALEARSTELAHQSRLTGEAVGLIVLDLDRFKRVNDEHGHATGDRVLQEVAYRIRARLRAFDLAYRLGGEEFVVLLPGASAKDARHIADELWAAIRDAPVGGLPVTASVGVAVSDAGAPFSFACTFRAADQALYDAKAGGRDRVIASGPPQPAPAPAVA